MKSWKNLYPELISTGNLLVALDAASKGKRDQQVVSRILKNPAPYIAELQRQLEEGTWEPSEHSTMLIQDGPSRKWRTIVRPNFREQIVHHALVQTLQPVFTRGMYEYSCGSIPGRGPAYGKRYIEKYIRSHPKGCRYVLQMDIRKFFQSIDHNILMHMLMRQVRDAGVLWLRATIIDSYHDPGACGGGLPIGYYTSQWFSNYYLQGLDHYIKETLGAPCYVRYMDDMVIVAGSKRKLHRARAAIAAYLADLHLTMKENWQVFKFDWIGKDGRQHGRFIDFMGYRFYRNRTVLRRRTWLKASKKARRIEANGANWYSACQMLSYMGFTASADCHAGYVEYIKPHANKRLLREIVSRHDRRKGGSDGSDVQGIADGGLPSTRG